MFDDGVVFLLLLGRGVRVSRGAVVVLVHLRVLHVLLDLATTRVSVAATEERVPFRFLISSVAINLGASFVVGDGHGGFVQLQRDVAEVPEGAAGERGSCKRPTHGEGRRTARTDRRETHERARILVASILSS